MKRTLSALLAAALVAVSSLAPVSAAPAEGEENYLAGKTIVFLGSSVTYGASSGGWSMCDYLAENYDCTVVKWAVSGTTLVDNGALSYVQRLDNESAKQDACDYFICQLSTNDASQNKPLGTLSDSTDPADFDKTTIIGAIEYIIATAKAKWDCPVAFYTGTKYDSALYQQMVDALAEVQDKWDIGVIDLWNDAEMNAVSDSDYASYMADPIHPNRKGYEEWWGPKFAEYLLAAFTPAPVSSEAAPVSSGAAEEEGGSLPMLAVAAIAFVATLAVAGVVALIVTKAGGKKSQ